MGETGAGQQKQQLSRKDRVPPSRKKAEGKSESISHIRKEWSLEAGTTARKAVHNSRSLVAILVSSSSTLVSCCGWKANREGGGAGGTKSPFVARPGERRFSTRE